MNTDKEKELLNKAAEFISKNEGFIPYIYKDTLGIETIGYGRNLQVRPLSEYEKKTYCYYKDNILHIDKEYSFQYLYNEVFSIYAKVKWELYFIELNEARKIVILDMIYNLGKSGFDKFIKFKEALCKKDYKTAAIELSSGSGTNGKSKYLIQVKSRAERNIKIIKSGIL